jgi:hypothetical protein
MDPEKVELLDYCSELLNGKESAEGLAKAIAVNREKTLKLKKDFNDGVSQRNQEVQSKCHNEIHEAEEALNFYLESLNILEKYVKDSKRQVLLRGMESVRRGLVSMTNSFFRYQLAAMVAEGPTDMPNYNLLFQSVKKYQENTGTKQEVLDWIKAMKFSVEQMKPAFEKNKKLETIQRFLHVLDKHQETLTNIEQNLQKNQPVNDLMEQFKENCEMLREVQNPAVMEILSSGPTHSITANVMIHTTRMFIERTANYDQFTAALNSLEGEYQYFKKQLEIIHSSGVNASKELAEEALKHMEIYGQAVEYFHHYQETFDVEFLRRGVLTLEEAMKKLYETSKTVFELGDREGKVPCVRCQHYNPSDRKTCEKCGAVLVKSIEDKAQQLDDEIRQILLEMPATENIRKILEAGDNIIQGNISKEEFSSAVDWMDGVVQDNWKPIEEAKKKEKLSQVEEEAYLQFSSGVRTLKEGLSKYRQYLETENTSFIKEGARLILLGAYNVFQFQKKAPQIAKKVSSDK